MKLRTSEPYWLIKNGLLSSYPSLQNNERAQVVVVGGGITGALVSYSLLQNNYDVILLDKRNIGMGSTAATTSLLQYEIDVPLYKLAEQIGETGAVQCYKAAIEAIFNIAQLIKSEGFNCGFDFKKSLFVARTEEESKWLKKEFAIRDKYKLGVEWLDDKIVFDQYGVKCFGAILSETAASVDAYKLTHQLISHSVSRGMRVYDQTSIGNIQYNADGVIIQTLNGYHVKSDKIVFCTGYEINRILKESVCSLHYTYVCISEQNVDYNSNLDDILIWDTGSPYFYTRTTEDKRLLIGGADSKVYFPAMQNTIKKFKEKQLLRQLNSMMPGINFIPDFSWGGIFGSTKDGLPYIGESKECMNAIFALGYGGNGIVFSVQAMEIINALLLREQHPLVKWYRFGR